MLKGPPISEDNKRIAPEDRKSIKVSGLGHHRMGSGD